VRGAPDADWNDPLREEYWLRVDATRVREVAASLGEVPETDEPDAGSGFACGDCGQQVAEDADVCPKCGARFDD
jgi:rubrerythrin